MGFYFIKVNLSKFEMPVIPKILLVTFQWSTLTEMPHLLKQIGCEVHLLCPSNNLVIRTSFYDRWIDSGESLDTLMALLVNLANDKIYTYILIGDDPILWKIYTENIAALKYLLPILNESALPMLSKIGFAKHCHRNAIPSPNFKSIDCKVSAHEALQQLGLPLVIKENYSNGGNGVRVFKDGKSYGEYIDAYAFDAPLLAQQYLVGELIGVDALFKRGKLLQYACSVDISPTFGPSTQRRYFQNDEKIGAILKQIGGSALLHGFANVSLIREAASQNYSLFEADPRPTKWVSYARWFGRDFSVAFKQFLVEDESDEDFASNTADIADIDCWEVEFFPDHAGKLFNQGRNDEAIIHLIDFKKNCRYTNYDPILLEAKAESLRQRMKFQGSHSVMLNNIATGNLMTITIDNKEYDLDKLSDEAKAQIVSIQFVDAELQRVNAQAAVLQTARVAYAKGLTDILAKEYPCTDDVVFGS